MFGASDGTVIPPSPPPDSLRLTGDIFTPANNWLIGLSFSSPSHQPLVVIESFFFLEKKRSLNCDFFYEQMPPGGWLKVRDH